MTRVLIVEDQSSHPESLRQSLQNEGYEVVNGVERRGGP